jgi:hypothetical protein
MLSILRQSNVYTILRRILIYDRLKLLERKHFLNILSNINKDFSFLLVLGKLCYLTPDLQTFRIAKKYQVFVLKEQS